MAPELKRKGAGEDEELTTNSFWGLIWAEKGRGADRHEGAELDGAPMAAGGKATDFGGFN